MNARVVTASFWPHRVDDAVDQYRSMVVPAARKQKGYKGRLLCVNRETGKALSITLWETEADMIGTEDNGYPNSQFSNFESLFADPPTTEHYEVSFQDRMPAPEPSR